MKTTNMTKPTCPRRSLLAFAIMGLSPQVMAQESIRGGEFRKDNSAPQIYSQEGMVDKFAQWLPVGATFSPLLIARDVENGDLTARIVQTSGVDTGTPGQYVAQFKVTDDGLPMENGFPLVGPTTTTFSLAVTVYDPAIEQPHNTVKFEQFWQEPSIIEGSLIAIAPGEQLSRSFRIEGDSLPLLGETVQISNFRVKEANWGGNNREFTILLTDGQSGEPIFEGPVTFETGEFITFILPESVSLLANKDYNFTVRYLAGEFNQGFRLNEESQLWLTASGQQVQAIYPYAQVLPDPANVLAFDPGLDRPVKTKLLSSQGGSENLYVRKLAGTEQTLTYVIKDSGLASLQVQPGTQQDTLVLSGLAAGETDLEIQANGELVDMVRLIVTTPKEIAVSYSYIAFPDETYTHLWDDGTIIQSDMTRRYAPLNVQLRWVDNGILVHEWDKDGDGTSQEDDRSEKEAPFYEGWIPNQTQVFSNLYILRRYKDPSTTCSHNGGGSSIGMGPTDIPPRASYRSACPGNYTELGQSETLTHELGHNLGLSHYPQPHLYYDSNIMGFGEFFFASQWRVIHDTVSARILAGDQGVSEVLNSSRLHSHRFLVSITPRPN